MVEFLSRNTTHNRQNALVCDINSEAFEWVVITVYNQAQDKKKKNCRQMAATHSGILSTLSLVMLTIVNQGKEKREERNWRFSYQQLLAAVFSSLPLSARIAPRVWSIEREKKYTLSNFLHSLFYPWVSQQRSNYLTNALNYTTSVT